MEAPLAGGDERLREHHQLRTRAGEQSDGTPNPAYEVLVDMDNLIDYMLLTIYVGNYDAPFIKTVFP